MSSGSLTSSAMNEPVPAKGSRTCTPGSESPLPNSRRMARSVMCRMQSTISMGV